MAAVCEALPDGGTGRGEAADPGEGGDRTDPGGACPWTGADAGGAEGAGGGRATAGDPVRGHPAGKKRGREGA